MEKGKDDTKLRSWVSLIAGLAGIAYQQWTGEVNWVLLLIFTSMAGVPGLAEIISLIKNSPIQLQSSSSRQQLLEKESDNVSSKPLEDKHE